MNAEDAHTATPSRRRVRALVRAALTVGGLVVIAWVWPTRFGGDTTVLAVEGSSMQPTFASGDLVVARAQDSYAVGDIVVFAAPTTPGHTANIVHRVIGIGADGRIVTQGDGRRTADSFDTTRQDIIGRVRWRVPQGANALHVLSRWWVLAFLTGCLVTARLWPGSQADEVLPDSDGVARDDECPLVTIQTAR